MKKRTKGEGATVTLTFSTGKIAEAFDNPDMIPALGMLHTLLGEHIGNLSRERAKKPAKKGKRRKKTG